MNKEVTECYHDGIEWILSYIRWRKSPDKLRYDTQFITDKKIGIFSLIDCPDITEQ